MSKAVFNKKKTLSTSNFDLVSVRNWWYGAIRAQLFMVLKLGRIKRSSEIGSTSEVLKCFRERWWKWVGPILWKIKKKVFHRVKEERNILHIIKRRKA